MTTLATRRYRRVLDLVNSLIHDMDTDRFTFQVAAQLNQCLNGNATILMDRYDLTAGTTAGVAWAPDEVASIPGRIVPATTAQRIRCRAPPRHRAADGQRRRAGLHLAHHLDVLVMP